MSGKKNGAARFWFGCVFSVVMIRAAAVPFFAPKEPAEIAIFRKAYPSASFKTEYDDSRGDWRILISVPERKDAESVLYWCDGRLLPETELDNRESFRRVLYAYPESTPDPARLSEEDAARIRSFGSDENRRNGAVAPPFFFDAIYDCAVRSAAESHLARADFLGAGISVHEKVKAPLEAVAAKVAALSETDAEVRNFVSSISRADGYYWRTVRDTNSRSFHSMGLAVDILPKGWGKKIVYWNWQKQADPENWMLTPLSARWSPPQAVISAFESEGFIWGGRWAVWDNMHFEYRPELIYAQKLPREISGRSR